MCGGSEDWGVHSSCMTRPVSIISGVLPVGRFEKTSVSIEGQFLEKSAPHILSLLDSILHTSCAIQKIHMYPIMAVA